MKDIIKFLRHKGEGVNRYSTENQTLWNLILEIFQPKLKAERRLNFYASRMRGSGY